MSENKAKICEAFLPALQLTNAFSDLKEIRYEGGLDEYVYLTFNTGYTRRVCVTADSGKAMLQDILGGLS